MLQDKERAKLREVEKLCPQLDPNDRSRFCNSSVRTGTDASLYASLHASLHGLTLRGERRIPRRVIARRLVAEKKRFEASASL